MLARGRKIFKYTLYYILGKICIFKNSYLMTCILGLEQIY